MVRQAVVALYIAQHKRPCPVSAAVTATLCLQPPPPFPPPHPASTKCARTAQAVSVRACVSSNHSPPVGSTTSNHYYLLPLTHPTAQRKQRALVGLLAVAVVTSACTQGHSGIKGAHAAPRSSRKPPHPTLPHPSSSTCPPIYLSAYPWVNPSTLTILPSPLYLLPYSLQSLPPASLTRSGRPLVEPAFCLLLFPP